jgi:hypothetical protein
VRRGITLTEVLIAVLVMVLGILPVLTLFSSEDRESAFIGQKLVVHNYLRELADLTQSACITNHFQRGAFEEGPRQVTVAAVGDGIKVTERVQFFPTEKVPGLYVLRVEAHWTDNTSNVNAVREQVLTRMICDPDYGTRHTAWPPGVSPATVVTP